MDKTFTLLEAEAVLRIADALDGERINEAVVDFSSRTLALATGVHPHLCESMLDWLGVFPMRPGYRRSTEQLRTVIAEHLESAQRQYAAHLERLRAQGLYVCDDPAPHVDTVGEVQIGDTTFAP